MIGAGDSRRAWPRAVAGYVAVLILLAVVGMACVRMPPATPELGPAEVTAAFYRWYLGYPGNVVVDGAYRTSPYLADGLIARVDDASSSGRPGGGDPFLLAQDIPERFEVGDERIEGDRAVVTVNFYWQGNATPVVRAVRLVLVDREWLIEGVEMG